MKPDANITEIFSSLQGEGPHTGEPTTFVRFAGCNLACRWCDTPHSMGGGSYFRIESPPRSKGFLNYPNPVSVKDLSGHLAFFSDPVISITGGEPLEQADFIEKWLENDRPQRTILLETNGVLYKELLKVGRFIDIFSVDIKLPSSSGIKSRWAEHKEFLFNAVTFGKEVYVKIVVTKDTVVNDIQEAIKVVSSVNKFIPVILQPASDNGRAIQKIPEDQIASFARLCNMWLPNVSIMRQMHKENNIL